MLIIPPTSPTKNGKIARFFVKNVHQSNAKPIAFQQNLPRKFPQNQPFFAACFLAKFALKIPANFPQNRLFYLPICLWKTHKIWPFLLRPNRGPEKEWKQAALTKESLQDFSEQFAQPH